MSSPGAKKHSSMRKYLADVSPRYYHRSDVAPADAKTPVKASPCGVQKRHRSPSLSFLPPILHLREKRGFVCFSFSVEFQGRFFWIWTQLSLSLRSLTMEDKIRLNLHYDPDPLTADLTRANSEASSSSSSVSLDTSKAFSFPPFRVISVPFRFNLEVHCVIFPISCFFNIYKDKSKQKDYL